MQGCGDLPKLKMEGKCYDLLLRKSPHDENNQRRFKKAGKATWYDKAIVCVLKHNEHFQDAETQAVDFGRSVVSYLLDKSVRSILLDAMRSGMNSQKLVEILEKDDADYWKMLQAVEPQPQKMRSLDEVLCDEGIKCLSRRLLKPELSGSFDSLDSSIKHSFYLSGTFPSDLESMFRSG